MSAPKTIQELDDAIRARDATFHVSIVKDGRYMASFVAIKRSNKMAVKKEALGAAMKLEDAIELALLRWDTNWKP